MGGLDLHQCGCFVPNILGRGGQIFEIWSPDSAVLIIRLELSSRTRYWISSNIRSTIFYLYLPLKMLQRKRSASENECHTQCHTLPNVETQICALRFDFFLFAFIADHEHILQIAPGVEKKNAAELKSIFCSIRYSKPSTFFEGSYSIWFGNSRFKICDEWPFRYFKIFQSLSLQDATRHRMINHCDQTSGKFRG